MKIYVFPADKFGCGHYRLIWPAEALRNQGHDVVIVDPSARDAAINGVMDGDTMVDVQIPSDADVMVFQRVTHRYIADAIRLIRQRGVAVVIDMDDDLASIHPSNPAFEFLHPRGKYPDHSWHNAQRACDDATSVVVSTPALLNRYGRHGQGFVFDNYVPGRYLDVPHTDSDLLGWPGSVHSHPDDLQAMGSSVNRLVSAGFKFGIVGNIEGVHRAWGLAADTQINATGAVPIEVWPEAVTNLGVGVAPLADTSFNASKSWLKMAELAAVGVPVVASPRAEYARLHKLGVGWLAKDQKDWFRKLKLLAESESARTELAEQGRDVMAGMTIEANAWKLAEIWTDALKKERTKALGAFSRR
jgi:hypothetical protein